MKLYRSEYLTLIDTAAREAAGLLSDGMRCSKNAEASLYNARAADVLRRCLELQAAYDALPEDAL